MSRQRLRLFGRAFIAWVGCSFFVAVLAYLALDSWAGAVIATLNQVMHAGVAR